MGHGAGALRAHGLRKRVRSHGARSRVCLALEREGKIARDDATKFSKAVIAEENRLIAIIEPEEKRLQGIQDVWDAIEEQKRQAEADRIAKQQERVEAIKNIPLSLVGKPAAVIADVLEKTKTTIDLSSFEEFNEFAAAAYETTVAALEQLHAGAVAQEQAAAEAAEKARRDAEELAKLRAEQEERQRTEAARIAQEAQERARAEAESKARIEAEEAAARARIEAAEAESRKQREAEEARLKVERDRLEAARIQQEGIERAAREKAETEAKAQRQKEEAAERERQRIARETMETDQLLTTVRLRIDGASQFDEIATAIDTYFINKQERKAA